jgi:Uncharacterized conserved protein
MAFLESPRFEICPKFGLTWAADYAVDIVEVANGEEYRNQQWSQARRTAQLTVGPGPELVPEVQYVLRHWHVVAGRTHGFRCQDATDYKSCDTDQTPTALDQPVVFVTGVSPEGWQLTKLYTVGGSLTTSRDITKPRSPILLADNGSIKTEGSDYMVDYTSGIVTLNFSPTEPLTWGGEFDIPVRFDSELPIEVLETRLQTVTFALREIRYEAT